MNAKPATAAERKLTSSRTRGSVDWTSAFLKSLEETGVIAAACRAAKISRVSVWERRKNDSDFKARFEDSLSAGALLLEEEAVRRAREGVRRIKFNPKTNKPYEDPATGQPYVEHEYSDNLLLALLRRHFPQYRDKADAEVHVTTNVQNVISAADQKHYQDRMQKALGR